MRWLLHTRNRIPREKSNEGREKGDIVVVITANIMTTELVSLACITAKRAGCTIRLLSLIEVPRSLPLQARLTKEGELSEQLLVEALAITKASGCKATPVILQARDSASAIVEEVKESAASLLLLGVRRNLKNARTLDEKVLFIMKHAPCRIWLIQDIFSS